MRTMDAAEQQSIVDKFDAEHELINHSEVAAIPERKDGKPALWERKVNIADDGWQGLNTMLEQYNALQKSGHPSGTPLGPLYRTALADGQVIYWAEQIDTTDKRLPPAGLTPQNGSLGKAPQADDTPPSPDAHL